MRKYIVILLIFVAVYLIFVKKYFPNDRECRNYSVRIIGEKEYSKVYEQLIDTISNWYKYRITPWQQVKWDYSDKIDSMMCFNRTKDKMITAYLYRDMYHSDATQDGILWFYGVKIKEQWYFFQGPSITLIRSAYQSDSSVPLSFSKLHELAVEHIFRGYLHQSLFDKIFRPNHWNINKEFFEQLDDGAYNTPGISKQEYEESWLRLNKENWSKIDTTNYD